MSGANRPATVIIKIGPLRFRPHRWATVFLAVGLPILIGLGLWQVKRADWKAGVIAAMEARLAAPAVAYDGSPTGPVEDWRFRRVSVSGRFEGSPVYVHHIRDGVAGWRILRRFVSVGDRATFYVDDGFLEGGPDGPAETPPALEGIVLVEGALREPQEAGLFTPPPDVAERRLFVRDPAMAAEIDGLAQSAVTTSFVIVRHPDPDETDDLITEANVALRNNHAEYALTWFGLASALLGVYGFWHVQRGRFTVLVTH